MKLRAVSFYVRELSPPPENNRSLIRGEILHLRPKSNGGGPAIAAVFRCAGPHRGSRQWQPHGPQRRPGSSAKGIPTRLILAGIAELPTFRVQPVCEVGAAVWRGANRRTARECPSAMRPTSIPQIGAPVESKSTNRTEVAASGTQIEKYGRSFFPGRLPGHSESGAEVRAVSNYTDDPRSAWRIEESAEKLAKTIIRILPDYE